eukprot:GEMP01044842.1.p1 GENE.GEMP01044842.1~~GEMP01044842.1.p1  ORF type:complete len:220 (+),score=37.40 GEMP01044842.1:38-697(+)
MPRRSKDANKTPRISPHIAPQQRMPTSEILALYKSQYLDIAAIQSESSTREPIAHSRSAFTQESEDSDVGDIAIQDAEGILSQAWEAIGEVPLEIEKNAHLAPCMMMLPDNLMELLGEADLDDNLRQQLFGNNKDFHVRTKPAPRKPSMDATSRKKRALRNPWYSDPKTWYVHQKCEDQSHGEYVQGSLSSVNKANLHICDVYRRYCIKEGKRIPGCLL